MNKCRRMIDLLKNLLRLVEKEKLRNERWKFPSQRRTKWKIWRSTEYYRKMKCRQRITKRGMCNYMDLLRKGSGHKKDEMFQTDLLENLSQVREQTPGDCPKNLISQYRQKRHFWSLSTGFRNRRTLVNRCQTLDRELVVKRKVDPLNNRVGQSVQIKVRTHNFRQPEDYSLQNIDD